uniref:Peroxisomal membrane protein PEX14-like KPWE domain-containing protein n=1 Tax=Dicentrarchus labrax TaxID=13489 RepID=A0A8C4NVG3_DICLA
KPSSSSLSPPGLWSRSIRPPTNSGQLSFAEVMRLVQEGKEVPGATKLDIKPTNQSPTPSQMGRILKPWEISNPQEADELNIKPPFLSRCAPSDSLQHGGKQC